MKRRRDNTPLQDLLVSLTGTVQHIPQSVWTMAPHTLQSSQVDSSLSLEDREEAPQPSTSIALRMPRDKRARRSVVRISIGSSLTGKIWLLGMSRAESGWDISLRTVNMLPDHAPIFELCRSGDLNGVRQMISSCAASIYDTSDDPSEGALLTVR